MSIPTNKKEDWLGNPCLQRWGLSPQSSYLLGLASTRHQLFLQQSRFNGTECNRKILKNIYPPGVDEIKSKGVGSTEIKEIKLAA